MFLITISITSIVLIAVISWVVYKCTRKSYTQPKKGVAKLTDHVGFKLEQYFTQLADSTCDLDATKERILFELNTIKADLRTNLDSYIEGLVTSRVAFNDSIAAGVVRINKYKDKAAKLKQNLETLDEGDKAIMNDYISLILATQRQNATHQEQLAKIATAIRRAMFEYDRSVGSLEVKIAEVQAITMHPNQQYLQSLRGISGLFQEFEKQVTVDQIKNETAALISEQVDVVSDISSNDIAEYLKTL